MWRAKAQSDAGQLDDADCDQIDILRHCMAWWFALLVVLLLGCILAFSDQFSPFWVLAYYPVSIVLCVLFSARICSPMQHHQGLQEARSTESSVASFDKHNTPTDENKAFAPSVSVHPRSSSRVSSTTTTTTTATNMNGQAVAPAQRQQTAPQNVRRDRKGASMYHIHGKSLKDQIHRMAHMGNTGRISEDAEKDTSADVTHSTAAPPIPAKSNLLSHQEELEERGNSARPSMEREMLDNGGLGLIIDRDSKWVPSPNANRKSINSQSASDGHHQATPRIEEHKNDAGKRTAFSPLMHSVLTLTKASPESSIPTRLSPSPRRKPLKEDRLGPSEGVFHGSQLKRNDENWPKTIDSPVDAGLREEAAAAQTRGRTPSLLEGSASESSDGHQEVIRDVSADKEKLGHRRSSSPRSLTSSMGYVSACNEPWQAGGLARRSILVEAAQKAEGEVAK